VENQIPDQTNTNPGGAAPADRCCRHTKTDGRPCHNWAPRGQDFCRKHDLFLHARTERPINVPLLEDEDSIVLLLSETLRAMAWGTLPVANGRILLDGCRLAHSIHSRKLETAKLRLKVRQMRIPEHEIFGGDAGLPSQPPASSQRGEANAEPDSDPRNLQPCEEPLTTPLLQPPDQRYHRFRDLKKNWDKEMLRGENEMTDMHHKRYGETKEDFLASRATPFEHLEAQDLELKKARDLSAALTAKKESATVND
jgi:hypothetical protein